MNRVLACLYGVCVSTALNASTFVTVHFPTGVSFDLPKNWVVLTKSKTVTLNAYLESVLPYISGTIKFQGNLKDDYGRPIATVQVYYWDSQWSQIDIRRFSEVDLADYNAALREQIYSELNSIGSKVLRWNGTLRHNLGPLSVLTSEYVRPGNLITGEFKVRISRIYCGNNSVSFVSSYHLGRPLSLQPIMERVMLSLKHSQC